MEATEVEVELLVSLKGTMSSEKYTLVLLYNNSVWKELVTISIVRFTSGGSQEVMAFKILLTYLMSLSFLSLS